LTFTLRSTLTALLFDRGMSPRVLCSGLAVSILSVLAALMPDAVDAHLGKGAAAACNRAGEPAIAQSADHGALAQKADRAALPALIAPLADRIRAAPFAFSGTEDAREQSVSCLAAAAWYEAGNDADSQRSVIQVVLNRVKHPSFPKTICGVVLHGAGLLTGCQFTFTCDGSIGRRRPGPGDWARARELAKAALDGAVDDAVRRATHYHADYVQPWWSGQMERIAQVGRHIFYRWPGAQGSLSGRPSTRVVGDDIQLARLGLDRNGALLPRPAGTIMAHPVALAEVAPASNAPSGTVSATSGPATSGRAIVMALDTNKLSGRWAVDALGRCADTKGCEILGYADAAQAARNASLPVGQRERPLFLFARDTASSMTLALWDCARVHRPDSSQCLPVDAGELGALLREPTSSRHGVDGSAKASRPG